MKVPTATIQEKKRISFDSQLILSETIHMLSFTFNSQKYLGYICFDLDLIYANTPLCKTSYLIFVNFCELFFFFFFIAQLTQKMDVFFINKALV